MWFRVEKEGLCKIIVNVEDLVYISTSKICYIHLKQEQKSVTALGTEEEIVFEDWKKF